MLNWSDFRLRREDLKNKGMIEKIDITNASVINSITGKLNKKEIRDEIFPSWRLTLQPGEEYDLGTALYGMYMVRSGAIGTTALILIGAGVSANASLSHGTFVSVDFTASGKIVLNKKELNGNVFVKNNRIDEMTITVMQITNY